MWNGSISDLDLPIIIHPCTVQKLLMQYIGILAAWVLQSLRCTGIRVIYSRIHVQIVIEEQSTNP